MLVTAAPGSIAQIAVTGSVVAPGEKLLVGDCPFTDTSIAASTAIVETVHILRIVDTSFYLPNLLERMCDSITFPFASIIPWSHIIACDNTLVKLILYTSYGLIEIYEDSIKIFDYHNPRKSRCCADVGTESMNYSVIMRRV